MPFFPLPIATHGVVILGRVGQCKLMLLVIVMVAMFKVKSLLPFDLGFLGSLSLILDLGFCTAHMMHFVF